MKRLLFTTNHLSNLAGSEIVSLEIVEHFLDRGWSVHVFTNLFDSPIREIFEELHGGNRLQVSTDLSDDLTLACDLIWIQHSLVPDKLMSALENGGVEAPIVWNHMSTIEPLEAPLRPDIEETIADISSGVSRQVLALLKDYGISEEQFFLFDNPAPDCFGETQSAVSGNALIKLAVISNHPPLEVFDAFNILREEGITLDFFGMGGNIQRVTPSLLSEYQGVVTIGKSTQYALSLGVPVFVYDHFGGEGWLSAANLEREAEYSFSGRSTRRKIDGAALAAEIVSGFAEAGAFAQLNREIFSARWKLSSFIDRLMSDPRVAAPKKKNLSVSQAASLRSLIMLNRRLFLHAQYRERESVLSREALEQSRIDHQIAHDQALHAIHQTLSWKITRPLRFLKFVLNRDIPVRG